MLTEKYRSRKTLHNRKQYNRKQKYNRKVQLITVQVEKTHI